MKKNILSMAALLMASAAVFTACSSDDNIIGEQPANPTGKYTMTVNASKGDDATTRALSIDDSGAKNVLNATWATTENVYVKKGDTWATGSLQPEADGATATLKGTLTGITPASSDVLTLQFPRIGERDYSGQVGTLADIAAKYDYATATVTVADVSATGNIIPEEATTTFTNQQAIVKFTLIDKADGSTLLNASQLVINDGTTDYTITPTSATSEIYAAIPGFSGQTVTLTATVGSDTYTYEKSGVSFTNGQYYEISVKMTKQIPVTTLDNTTTAWTDGNTFAVPAGGLTYSNAITVSGNVTLTLTEGTTLTLNKGISLASGATLTVEGNGTMNVNGTNGSTASTVAGTGMLVLTSGTLNAKGGNGQSLTINHVVMSVDFNTGASGGVAINGNVTVSGGTVTATGGNGGNLNTSAIDGTMNNHGGNGGAAISGNVTVNGGTWTATNGSNGTYTGTGEDYNCSAGAGGKAVAGTVTDNR